MTQLSPSASPLQPNSGRPRAAGPGESGVLPMGNDSQKTSALRLAVVSVLLGCGILGLGLRAYFMQVAQRDLYRALAEEQYLKEVELTPHRGRIFDRIGTELAASAEVDSVYVHPLQLRGAVAEPARRAVAEKLANILHLDAEDLFRKLFSERHFVWIKRRVLPDEARRVRELNLPGLALAQEPKRYYPNRSLAGTVLGWAGMDASGLEGVELAYDRFLRGSKSTIVGLKDARGRNVLVGGVGEVSRDHGNDVYLSIDKFIQYRLEQALEEGVSSVRAKGGAAVALDPRNGEIVAMASVPSVNPNDPAGARERGARNRAVTDPFEPGSTVKPFTLAAALEAGAVSVNDEWDCENGAWRVGRVTLHDAEPEGVLTTTQVLARSSNICTAKIARRLGKDKLYLFLRQLSFFAPTGVDLPGERAGQVRPVADWGDIAFANISFGQGMTATPLQLAAALSAIANGGTLYRPHIVRRIVSPTGQTLLDAPASGRRVMTSSTADQVSRMLRAVMMKKGTGEKLDIPGYPVAGKTGTAQKVDPATRRYSPEFWSSSFMGYAPVDSPRLLLFIVIDEPQEGHYGAEVAGPIFVKVMAAALPYLGVPPRISPEGAADAPASVGRATPVRRDSEPSPSPSPATIPDFTGMGLGRALEVARQAGLRLEVRGSGLVVGQEPAPHSARYSPVCQLRLAPAQ
ncbi:MAG: transpeptidase family protein [Myxococcales bacterium]|nr:transpeptidase family protein [Myxococcales bacterium]